jgi:vacuolar iron transporter family protein
VSTDSIDRPFRPRSAARPEDPERDARELQQKADQVARGGARAAVLGINDGLVSTVCLIVGVAGAGAARGDVRLAGFAALIAGAFSMAAGEWVSVRSQVELYEGVLDELRALVTRNPKLIVDRLTTALEDAGLDTSTAQRAAGELGLSEQRFFSFAARSIFGVNEDELGSPMTAALSSFCYFTIGAIVSLAPWFFIGGGAAIAASIIATGLASLVVGAIVARSSGRPELPGALRQLAIVLAASLVTLGVGAVFGATVS